jgi:hypothetical protein
MRMKGKNVDELEPQTYVADRRRGAGRSRTLERRHCRLALHDNAVMAVLFLGFGAKLIADSLPPLT